MKTGTKKPFYFLGILLILVMSSSGCTLITLRNPFADASKLGTVIGEQEHLLIENSKGSVLIENIAPTRRRITWNSETRDIYLFKSSALNGIYGTVVTFRPGPIDQIKNVTYTESTFILKTQKDINNLIESYLGYGYEHRPDDHLLVYLDVREYYKKGWKLMVIGILKYELDEKTGRPFRVDASY